MGECMEMKDRILLLKRVVAGFENATSICLEPLQARKRHEAINCIAATKHPTPLRCRRLPKNGVSTRTCACAERRKGNDVSRARRQSVALLCKPVDQSCRVPLLQFQDEENCPPCHPELLGSTGITFAENDRIGEPERKSRLVDNRRKEFA